SVSPTITSSGSLVRRSHRREQRLSGFERPACRFSRPPEALGRSWIRRDPNMDAVIVLVVGVVALLLGAGLAYIVTRQGAGSMTQRARDEARIMVEEAENRARKVELDANQNLLAKREELEGEAKERRSELSRAERRLEQREE